MSLYESFAKPRWRYGLFAATVMLLGGCDKERSLVDLENFVQTVHRDTVPRVDPLPELLPVESVLYQADGAADPFAPSNVFGKGDVEAEPEPDPLTPNASRVAEALEKFPLDALQLVGTMQIDAHAWALVSVPDGQIHRVVEGSYLGQNNGKVVAIDLDQSALEIEELLQGPTGRWEIRPTRLAVNH